MIIVPLRALTRAVTFLLLLVLAAAGLAAAVFSTMGDNDTFSLPRLARHLHLPELRGVVGDYLGALEASGHTAWISVAAGAGAVLLGLALLAGALAPRRERLVVLDEDSDGARLAVGRRPLSQIAAVLADQQRGVTQTKARVRPRRLGRRGLLHVSVFHPRNQVSEQVAARVSEAVGQLGEAFGLKTSVRARRGERGRARVQ